jgi:hypothetical protein
MEDFQSLLELHQIQVEYYINNYNNMYYNKNNLYNCLICLYLFIFYLILFIKINFYQKQFLINK